MFSNNVTFERWPGNFQSHGCGGNVEAVEVYTTIHHLQGLAIEQVRSKDPFLIEARKHKCIRIHRILYSCFILTGEDWTRNQSFASVGPQTLYSSVCFIEFFALTFAMIVSVTMTVVQCVSRHRAPGTGLLCIYGLSGKWE